MPLWVALVALSACQGVVVVAEEDGDGVAPAPHEDAHHTDQGGEGGVAPWEGDSGGGKAEATWAPSPDGGCLSCSGWIEACDESDPCPSPTSACHGAQQDLVDDVVQCVCSGCMDLCHGNCVMFNDVDDACRECQIGVLKGPCGIEYFNCVD